ncbi:aldehyde dehydrogenase [Konateibacter massiliensis]|uniref:aldehyde dehydrogenase n=1 Tax=Konateibacter massiliensis TaxID=2002841 RepID=UPI000C150145|nr:aldehyde dehydrogenase [Konateibacter massiliensis]
MNYNEITTEEALDIFNECQRFFRTEKTYSISFRIAQLVKLKKAIRRYESSIMRALYKDLGKSNFESYATEVGFTQKSISEAIKNLKTWSKDVPVKTPFYLMPARSRKVYEPYGTVLIMAPFNYPFQLLIEPLVGAICAGNCAVLKPSELTPWTSMVVAKMISEIFHPGYICCVEGGINTNQALLKVPFHYIFFTGSIPVGKIVMEHAAKHLTPVTLELGGKSPVIVDEAANIKWAASRIAWGKFLNVGQTCIAPDYVLVHSSVKDNLVEELKKSILRFYGEDAKSSASYGRIVNDRHFERLSGILKADEEYLIYGGAQDAKIKYIEPTLLEISDLSAACMKEELFGPLLPIITYETIEEAKEIIQTMPTPLALYLFTCSKQTRNDIVRHIASGGICINDTIEHIVNPELPFGGVGSSGMGSYHGKQSFLTFSHEKSVLTRIGSIEMKFLSPPYTNGALRLLKKVLH